MNEMTKQFQTILIEELSLKPVITQAICEAIPDSDNKTVAYVIEHYTSVAMNLSSNERQALRKALKEVGVPDGLLPGKGRPRTEKESMKDLNDVTPHVDIEAVKKALDLTGSTTSGNILMTEDKRIVYDNEPERCIVILPSGRVECVAKDSEVYMAAVDVYVRYKEVELCKEALEKAENVLQEANEKLNQVLEGEHGNT